MGKSIFGRLNGGSLEIAARAGAIHQGGKDTTAFVDNDPHGNLDVPTDGLPNTGRDFGKFLMLTGRLVRATGVSGCVGIVGRTIAVWVVGASRGAHRSAGRGGWARATGYSQGNGDSGAAGRCGLIANSGTARQSGAATGSSTPGRSDKINCNALPRRRRTIGNSGAARQPGTATGRSASPGAPARSTAVAPPDAPARSTAAVGTPGTFEWSSAPPAGTAASPGCT